MICMARPEDAWKAMWQWKIQAPGMVSEGEGDGWEGMGDGSEGKRRCDGNGRDGWHGWHGWSEGDEGRTRIIRLKRDDGKTTRGQHHDVPPCWVVAVDVSVLTIQLVRREFAIEARPWVARVEIVIPGVFRLVQDGEIVPVQMHRMRGGEELAFAAADEWERGRSEDHPDPLVFDVFTVGDDVQVGAFLDQGVDLVQVEKSRVAEIDAKGVGVNGPSELVELVGVLG
jgi:hypothetical protein